MKMALFLGAAFAAYCLLGVESAYAEASSQETGLEEVIVTAQKRSESSQKLPAVVTVVSAERMVEQGITDVRRLQDLVPSSKFQQEGAQTRLWLRGVGQFNDQDQLDPAVAAYVDQVYVPRPALWSSFYDVERAEVLFGPQGTLYGRNTAGGAVLITTRKPGDDYAGDGFFEVGNYDAVHVSGGVDLPASDVLKFRLAADVDYRDGFFKNGLEARDRRSGRATMVYEPNEALSVTMIGEYNRDVGKFANTVNRPYAPTTSRTNDPFDSIIDADLIGYASNIQNWKAQGQIDYQFGNMTLTYIPAFLHYRDKTFSPSNGQSFDTYYAGDQFSQELRLANEGRKLNWLFGLFQYYSNTDFLAKLPQGNFGIFDPMRPNAQYMPPYTQIVTIGPSRTITNSYAIFGQGVYKLSDSLRATLGARYSYDRRRGDVGGLGVDFPLGIPGVFPPFSIPKVPFDETRHWDHFDFKAGIEKDIGPQSIVYANIQSGYIPGGYQNSPAPAGGDSWFKPETLVGLAVGAKNRFDDNRIQLNLEAFYYRYRNYQVSVFNATQGAVDIFNAQESIIYGLDAQIRYQFTSNDQISIDIGLLSAKFHEFTVPDGADYSGFRMTNAPAISATVAYQHVWELANGGTVRGNISIHAESDYWGDHTHGNGSHIPAYSRSDANLTYSAPDGRWSFGAWVKNIENTNKIAVVALGGFPGPAAVCIEPPRTYGVRLGFKF